MTLRSRIEAMERRLLTFLGPAQLGDAQEAPPPPVQQAVCPACGRPLAEHRVDRSGGTHNRVTCPTGEPPAPPSTARG